MRRTLLVLSVAVGMSLVLTGPAWADSNVNDNAHDCLGDISSDYSPEGTRGGQWASLVKPLAQKQQVDDETRELARHGNCGGNRVPT